MRKIVVPVRLFHGIYATVSKGYPKDFGYGHMYMPQHTCHVSPTTNRNSHRRLGNTYIFSWLGLLTEFIVTDDTKDKSTRLH